MFFAESPMTQTIIFVGLATIMFAYIVIFRPQKTRSMLFLNALAEAVLVFLHLFSLVFIDDDMLAEKRHSLGIATNILVASYIALNWILILGLLM